MFKIKLGRIDVRTSQEATETKSQVTDNNGVVNNDDEDDDNPSEDDDNFVTEYTDEDDPPLGGNKGNNDSRDDALQNGADNLNDSDDDDDGAGLGTRIAAAGANGDGLDNDSYDVAEDNGDDDDDDGVNIDSGFLKDAAGKEATLPETTTSTTVASPTTRTTLRNNNSSAGGPTVVFYFCLMGGMNEAGPVGLVDILNIGLHGKVADGGSPISAMPAALTSAATAGESSAAFTGSGVTACGTGFTLLTPYGYSYVPGSCYDYSFAKASWNETGPSSRLASYRKGATITRVGKVLLAAGGRHGRRSLRSIEVYDIRRPDRGWRRTGRMAMPAAVSEHCTVAVLTTGRKKDGGGGSEVIVTGGQGRENRAMKLDLTLNK